MRREFLATGSHECDTASWAMEAGMGAVIVRQFFNPTRTFSLAATLGIACALCLSVFGWLLAATVPEWAAQLVWLAVVLAGAAVCGYRSPERAWRWGAIIVGVQPLCVFVMLLVVREPAKPSSAFGGMAAVFIFTFFMVFMFPLAALASHLGASRRLHQQ